jgi:hypothetical protein
VAKYFRSETFVARAREHFDFLVTHHGFDAPRFERYAVVYTRPAVTIEVLYDSRDGRVITQIDGVVSSGTARASLDCLYAESGLGPAQDVRDIARSGHSLEVALISQAQALDRLLPVLSGSRGRALLDLCHGR